MNIKVLITGGHVTPAVAVIRQLQKQGATILLVGRDYTDVSKAVSKEETAASQLGISFETIDTGKLHRGVVSQNFKEIPKIIRSFIKARLIINHFQPDVVLSFGGYVALPICLVAKQQKIPIITHEQTTILGLTNRILQYLGQTTLAWKNTRYAPPNAHVVGNPVRSEFLSPQSKPSWLVSKATPIIYITGGNQGSRTINQATFNVLTQLLEKFIVVHQLGNTQNQADYRLAQKLQLPSSVASRYYPRIWLEASEVAWCMQHAQLVISRAGANTVVELLLSKAYSILVPLPSSAGNEQLYNARRLEALGLATILDQSNIDRLPNTITLASKHHNLDKNSKVIHSLIQQHTQAAETLALSTIKCAQKKIGDNSNP